ncbi:MAG: metallophosphoesterase [Streptosporangiales bacterium]|nr:metallophosphoesterase [Streptosporangiales bacterium]
MRVHVVSDVHGRADALAHAKDGADAVFCLGDLLNFVDYHDSRLGIFAELFGPANAEHLIALRTAKRFDEARTFSRGLWGSLDGDPKEHIDRMVRRQYDELFGALPTPAYCTYGNVDVPGLWAEYVREGQTVLDGETVELDGWTFGFVGGGLPSPYRTPNEVDEDVYAAKIAAVAGADVICTHIPPAVPDLLYDVVARRFERGSEVLLETIRREKPRYVLFGHVHQPLVRRMRIGVTECLNVGHFRASGVPHRLVW